MADPHLGLRSDEEGLLLDISAPQFLVDLEQSVVGGFSGWILDAQDPRVLERGQPRLLEIREGDAEGTRELETILRWGENEGVSG